MLVRGIASIATSWYKLVLCRCSVFAFIFSDCRAIAVAVVVVLVLDALVQKQEH